jgi:drug/metabolite transporter (DMT)-like permease
LNASGTRAHGLVALVGATALWGVTFTLVGGVVEGRGLAGALAFLCLRFGIATAVFVPLLPAIVHASRGRGSEPWRDGLSVGVLTFAGFLLQTLGLLETTPPRSAFVTSLSVVCVPFAAALVLRRALSRAHVGLSALALAGVGLVVAPGGALAPHRGELWTLACALVFAWQIVAVERALRRTSALVLTFGQIAATCLCAWIALALSPGPALEAWPGLYGTAAVTGIVCTSLCLGLVAFGQARIPAETTAVIFALEPIFAALFDGCWSSRWLDAWQWVGGFVVVASAIWAARMERASSAGPARSPQQIASD